MKDKWKIFCLTFLSYSLIHAVRRALSSLKYTLNSPPSGFSPMFLGTLDMMVLIPMAIGIVVLGPRVVNQKPLQALTKGALCLGFFLIGLAIVLLIDPESPFFYLLLYPIIGFLCFVGWPICIYILSLFFKKGISFSLWFGCTQFGDFIAVLLNLIFIQALSFNAGFFIFSIIAIVIISYLLNVKYLIPTVSTLIDEVQTGKVQAPVIEANVHFVDQKELQHPSLEQMEAEKNSHQKQESRIDFITVWTLEGVPGYILSFIFVKGVNAMISGWMVFYLAMIGMVKQSNLIILLWSVSTFGGGILGVYLNRRYTKKIFIFSLLVSAVFFIFLEEMHLFPHQIEVIILILACGVSFGGPYTLMNTSIPLHLSEKPHIKNHPDAKTAIVSAMEGYSLLFCAISLLIIPAVGIVDLHWVAFFFCLFAALVLIRQEYKEYIHWVESEREKNLKKLQNKVKPSKEVDRQLSANLEGVKSSKRGRRSRRKSAHSSGSIEREGSQKTSKGSDSLFYSREHKSQILSNKKDQKESFPTFLSNYDKKSSELAGQDFNQLPNFGKQQEPGEEEKEAEKVSENVKKGVYQQGYIELQEVIFQKKGKGDEDQHKEMGEQIDYLSMA